MCKDLKMSRKIASKVIRERIDKYEYSKDDYRYPQKIGLNRLSEYLGYSRGYLSQMLTSKEDNIFVWRVEQVIDSIPKYAKKYGYVKKF